MEDKKSWFWKLGAFGKFDYKRFSSDAEKIQIRRSESVIKKKPTVIKPDKEYEEKTPKKRSKKYLEALKNQKTNSIRKKNRIVVSGTDIPPPLETFAELQSDYSMKEAIIHNVKSQRYEEPTAIQRQIIPAMLLGRDVMACAPTGSGKTASFIIPILHDLRAPSNDGFRACILAPTRELAKQILREFQKLNEGVGLKSCYFETKKGAGMVKENFDVLITTPNRLVSMLKNEPPLISLKNVEWLIVDESDKLFEEGQGGFRDQLGAIYTACTSPKLRRGMFSATFAHDVFEWCQLNLDNVIHVYVGGKNTATDSVEQKLVYTGDETGKLVAFRNLVREGITPPVLVFVQSKERAEHLYKEIKYDGLSIDVIHGNIPIAKRDDVVTSFRLGKTWILICTELMGRGIDFKGVNLVINYDFPTTGISYIHRIGRTGRAGMKGKAVTFFTDVDTLDLRRIAILIRQAGCEVPEYMLRMRGPKKVGSRKPNKRAPKREPILNMIPEDHVKLKQNDKKKLANHPPKTGRNPKKGPKKFRKDGLKRNEKAKLAKKAPKTEQSLKKGPKDFHNRGLKRKFNQSRPHSSSKKQKTGTTTSDDHV